MRRASRRCKKVRTGLPSLLGRLQCAPGCHVRRGRPPPRLCGRGGRGFVRVCFTHGSPLDLAGLHWHWPHWQCTQRAKDFAASAQTRAREFVPWRGAYRTGGARPLRTHAVMAGLPWCCVVLLLLLAGSAQAVKVVLAPGATECLSSTVTPDHFQVCGGVAWRSGWGACTRPRAHPPCPHARAPTRPPTPRTDPWRAARGREGAGEQQERLPHALRGHHGACAPRLGAPAAACQRGAPCRMAAPATLRACMRSCNVAPACSCWPPGPQVFAPDGVELWHQAHVHTEAHFNAKATGPGAYKVW